MAAAPKCVSGPGALDRLPELAQVYGFRRTLLVADPGLVSAGLVEYPKRLLGSAGVEVHAFHAFGANPDTAMVETGREFALRLRVDSIVGLGGGSSMDCAKGINLLLTNGGRIEDYWGYGKAARPTLPMIGIPTTTGTGSEAQSYALISDAVTHVKMACGDPKLAFRCAILDPRLTVSQPAEVRATAGYDAVSHAVESYVTRKRNKVSDEHARRAWRLLDGAFERVVSEPGDLEALGAMQQGAWHAGSAIEHSMLGAAHACANPLTARFGTTHGTAIALLLSHVVRFNGKVADEQYRELHTDLPARLDELAERAGLPRRLRDTGVRETDLPMLAEQASKQWTGQFNPRPFDEAAALEIYRCAW